MMGWIVLFAVVWFVLHRTRWGMRRRARWGLMHPRGPRLPRPGEWGPLPPPRMHGGQPLPVSQRRAEAHEWRRSPEPPRETEFEALKRRYVAGELSDEQYEAALDALFRTPEGRRQV